MLWKKGVKQMGHVMRPRLVFGGNFENPGAWLKVLKFHLQASPYSSWLKAAQTKTLESNAKNIMLTELDRAFKIVALPDGFAKPI